MKPIKAIFFDADDTLIDHEACERQALMYLFKYIGLPYRAEYQALFRPLDRRLWENPSQYGINPKDIPTYRFKRLFELINAAYTDYVNANELFKQGLAQTTVLTEQAEETIRNLYQRGLTLCIVTNGLIALQRPRVIHSAIGEYIHQVIVSEEVGAPKPDPAIFNELLKRLSLEASAVMMVGDRLDKDIAGAKNAGITSVWFNPNAQENQTNIIPDYEIRSLWELNEHERLS